MILTYIFAWVDKVALSEASIFGIETGDVSFFYIHYKILER